MIEKIIRTYLEIRSFRDFKEVKKPSKEYSVGVLNPKDFQLNKFFYKNVGKKHRWTDRLVWSDKEWIKYSSNLKVDTYILKVSTDLAGYFEIILHSDLNEIEIAYLGLLEEYQNKKLGSYLLSEAIKKSFQKKNINRIWVHTCTLDHKNALKNYLARGMKIFKKENIRI